MYRKITMAFLLAIILTAMTGAPMLADGLLDPPVITMNIVGDYVFTNDIPKSYCTVLNGLVYDGKSLNGVDFSLLEPQDQYPEERLYLRIPLSHGKQVGEITVKFSAIGYKDTTATFSFPVDPDPQGQPSAPVLLSAAALSDTDVKITWKSTSKWQSIRYRVFRKQPGGNFEAVEEVEGTKLSYVDTGLKPDTEYIYAVDMVSVGGLRSVFSNEISVRLGNPLDPADTPLAPTILKAEARSDTEVTILWKSNSKWDAHAYNVFRKQPGGSFKVVKSVDGSLLSFTDSGLEPNKEYVYHVDMISMNGTHSNSSNEISVKTKTKEAAITTPPAVTKPVITTPVQPQTPTQTPAAGKTELRFYVGSSEYYIDNKLNTMDTTPVVSGGRTLLPITYVTTPLGAKVDWNAAEKKVTVKTKAKTIELWIGKNMAKINGVSTQIDPVNPSVQPEILPPGRIMLPLRFVTENMGCDLEWNPAIQEVKIKSK